MNSAKHKGGLEWQPAGWFALALSSEVKRGRAVSGTLATRDYRLERRDDGTLRCQGAAQIVVEQNGFILGWHHPEGQAPSWTVPVLDDSQWRPLQFHQLQAKTHPQEVFENSIDEAHFTVIHHFSDISVLSPMTTDCHNMRVRYAISRKSPVPGLTNKIRAEFEVFLHGIGCAHNTIDLPIGGIQAKMLVFATPTTEGNVDIRLGMTVQKRVSNPLLKAILPLIHRGAVKNIIHDFEQDCAIWNNKQFIAPPILVANDGPIGDFRRWCQQFYAAPSRAKNVRMMNESIVEPSLLIQ